MSAPLQLAGCHDDKGTIKAAVIGHIDDFRIINRIKLVESAKRVSAPRGREDVDAETQVHVPDWADC